MYGQPFEIDVTENTHHRWNTMKRNMFPNKCICLTSHEFSETLAQQVLYHQRGRMATLALLSHKRCTRREQRHWVRQACTDTRAEAGGQSRGSEESRWLCLWHKWKIGHCLQCSSSFFIKAVAWGCWLLGCHASWGYSGFEHPHGKASTPENIAQRRSVFYKFLLGSVHTGRIFNSKRSLPFWGWICSFPHHKNEQNLPISLLF